MKVLFSILFLAAAFCASGAKFEPGVAGQALRGRVGVPYDSEKITPKGGSAAFWFKLDKTPSELRNAMPLCFGTVGAGWCYTRFDRGALGINFKVGKGFSGTSCPVAALAPGEWHHAVFVWGIRKEQGFLRIYVDGELKLFQRLELPEKFSPGKFAVGYNSGHWKSPDFPGVLDEIAIFDMPIPEETVKKLYETGRKGASLPETPGMLLYLPFDGNTTAKTGVSASEEVRTKCLRAAARKTKVKKYPDEIEFRYSFTAPCPEEKLPGALNDGNDASGVHWRQRSIAVIGEFDGTVDVAEIEITTRKATKWYLLKQLRVSWDDGSGNFCDPAIVDTYAKGKPIGKALVDDTCRTYVYSVKNPGKMCRFKVVPVGDGYFGINEIRVRAKK